MAKMTYKELVARDAKRDIGAELLAAVREMKANKAGHVHRVSVSEILEARTRNRTLAAAVRNSPWSFRSYLARVGAGAPQAVRRRTNAV